jgi:hypothetical protein
VKPNDVDRVNQYDCEPIKGIQDLHSIKFVGVMDVNKIMKKNLSCFYYFCVDGNFVTCENLPWTEEWEVDIFIPCSTTFVCDVMLGAFDEAKWDQFGMNGDHLTSCLALGNNFVMNAGKNNTEGVHFYILMCMKPIYILQSPYTCAWGQQFETNDIVYEASGW